MRSEAERWTGALLHGWVEVITLFAMLAVALVLIGWCWNAGQRPSERRGALSLLLLVAAYALVLVLRFFQEGILPSIIIAVGVTVAGLFSRGDHHQGLWVPVMLLATLLGLGLNLSFLVLTVLIMLVLLLGAGRSR